MTNDATVRQRHAETWELIPWIVNGRASDEDAAGVAEHLAECADCRREIEVQRRLQAEVARNGSLEYAPQASFQKLMSRIEELEREVPEVAATGPATRPAVRPAVRIPRWFVASFVAQSLAMIVLTVFAGWQGIEQLLAPRYQTLTSSEPPPATPSGNLPAHGNPTSFGNLKIVPAPTVTVTELRSLLKTVGAQVVSGPTDAGVWTLVVPYATTSPAFKTMLGELRADSRVAFAEPIETFPREP
jgi:hypothetical protein